MFQFFDHTADLGLHIEAADLSTLFADAAVALFSAIIEDFASIEPKQVQTVEIQGTDRDYLLFDWLHELLYRFDTQHVVFCRFDVQVRENGLTAGVWGEPFDPAKHPAGHEVKAITYHELKVEQTAQGWIADVIVDI